MSLEEARSRWRARLAALLLLASFGVVQQARPAESQKPTVDPDGTVRMPAFAVPLSRYMSEQAQRKFIEEALKPPLKDLGANAPIGDLRAQVDDEQCPMIERAEALYPVNIEERQIGGIRTQIVTPKDGVSANNRKRVLINLHGAGAFGSFSGSPADPNTWGGDSRFIAPLVGEAPPALNGGPPGDASDPMNYIGNTDLTDPLVSPALSPAILAKFPPTLLITEYACL